MLTSVNVSIPDRIETIAGSLVQHGPLNDRVYVMHAAIGRGQELLTAAMQLCQQHGYTKIFAKVPESASSLFVENGYSIEARISGYFERKEDCCFVSLFLDDKRAVDSGNGLENRSPAQPERQTRQIPKEYRIRVCGPDDASALSSLYRSVFETYPFPVYDENYVLDTMKTGKAIYCAFWHGDSLAAAASAEIDASARAAEMTDFATADEHRGRGLSSVLLSYMEEIAGVKGILTAFTIARAISAPMNRVFARRGYAFGGRLVKNTSMCGELETMHVWHKPLTGPHHSGGNDGSA